MLVSGCVSAESRWRAAQKEDALAAYEAFLQKTRDARYATLARERIEELKFERAKREGTEQAYLAYLREFPEGRFAGEAKQAMIEPAFRTASRENTIEAYERFADRFPGTALATQASLSARSFRFDAARRARTVASFEDFLKRYPEGSDSGQLRRELPAVREWEPRRMLGELVIKLSPEVRATFMHGLESTPPPTYAQDLARIHELLDGGVNPNLVRIAGYRPVSNDSKVSVQDGVIVLNSRMSPGNRGYAVPADQNGMTLLEYCEANELIDAGELLKAHGAK